MPDMADMPDMPGMAGSGTHMSAAEAAPGWVTIVNWIATLGFAAVAVYWGYRWITRTSPIPAAQLGYAQTVTQTFTAAGTALMFAELV